MNCPYKSVFGGRPTLTQTLSLEGRGFSLLGSLAWGRGFCGELAGVADVLPGGAVASGGLIVTNMSAGPEGIVHFYSGRATVEQWIKEGKYALNWTRLSCHRFVANQVRLAQFILAYNSVQIKLIKIGARLVRHARRLVFQLAEVSVPLALFQGVLERIARLCPAPG